MQSHDDLRAALDWLAANDPDRALALAGALGWFWLSHGHIAEAAIGWPRRSWRWLTSPRTLPVL